MRVSALRGERPFQLFSRCPPHLKGRESGDVRAILDTKGKKSVHGRTGRPVGELQNRGAVDRRGQDTHPETRTLPFGILVGKLTDIYSDTNLTVNSWRHQVPSSTDQL